MSQNTIFLKDVLKTMRTLDAKGRAIPFSISFRTLNKNSKTGGRLISYAKAKQVLKEENPNINSVKSLLTKPVSKPKTRRKPNHWENKTRNIKIIPLNEIRKIHINHIITFNNKTVVY